MELKLDEILKIKDDDLRVSQLHNYLLGSTTNEIVKILSGLEKDTDKIKLLYLLGNPWAMANVICTLKSDWRKIIQSTTFNDPEITNFILSSIKKDWVKKFAIRLDPDNKYNGIIAASLKDKKTRKEYMDRTLKKIENDFEKAKILLRLSDEEKKEYLETIKNDENKSLVIAFLQDDEERMVMMQELEEEFKAYVILSLRDDELRKKLTYELTDDTAKLRVILNLEGDIDKLSMVRELLTDKKLISRIENMYKYNKDLLNTNYVVDNMLDNKATQVFYNKEYKILDNKYIDVLGEDIISVMSCYSDVCYEVTKVPEKFDEEYQLKKMKILKRCIEQYSLNNETEEWTPLMKRILINMDSYSDLILDIFDKEQLDKIDYEKLSNILIKGNGAQIENCEQIDNYEVLVKEKCDELINSKIIADKKDAICLTKFGHTYADALEMISKYGETIDMINDEDLKSYIKCLIELNNLNDNDVLKEIYDVVEPIKNANILALDRQMKNEYFKLYVEKGFFNIKEAIPTGEDNIYEMPLDEGGNVKPFNMMIHSLNAYRQSSLSNNYYNDWNRPLMASQHVCCSYIDRDMLATANCPLFFYGFNNFSKDALVLSSNRDMYSSDTEFVPIADHDEKYLPPREQINKTVYHNEMDIRRFQNGKRMQPDYIMIFKDNTVGLEKAKVASKQFEEKTGIKLPILIVDKDECIETTIRECSKKINEYIQTKDESKMEEIVQTLKNIEHSVIFDKKNKKYDDLHDISKLSKEESFKIINDMIKQYDIDKGKRLEENSRRIKPDKNIQRDDKVLNKSSNGKVTMEQCEQAYNETDAQSRAKVIRNFTTILYEIESRTSKVKNNQKGRGL